MNAIHGIDRHVGFGKSVWLQLERHPVAILCALFALCVAIFLAAVRLPRVDGQLIGSDGAFYYSYLPSLLLDRDLDFANQYAVFLPPRVAARQPLTPDAKPHNSCAIGPAILWAPFFLAGHLLAIGLRAAGYSIQLDGMGYVYQIPVLLGSMAYSFAGMLLLNQTCRRFFNAASSAFAVILTWFTTNLIYYMIAEPSMSHACSFFAAALFLSLWLSYRPDPTMRQWFLLGISGGIIALVRQPDAVWLALPAIDCMIAARTDWRVRLPRYAKGIAVFGITAAIAFVPQLIIWRELNGTAVQSGYSYAGNTFHWLSPRILPLLFSLNHGLFSWHPALLLAAIGLAILYRREKAIMFSLFLVAAIHILVVSSWYGWSGGDSFGSRMLISMLPILTLGFAALIDWTAARRAFVVMSLLAGSFLLWNGLFFLQYRFGYISKIRTITFYQLTVGKLEVLKDFPSLFWSLIR
jgi:hypothetical protein